MASFLVRAFDVPDAGINPVIGVYSTTYRRATRVFTDGDSSRPVHGGEWVQVSRLGHPLVNEVVVPLGLKDAFNASEPTGDGAFLPLVTDPELARLIPVLYPGVEVPPAPRNDLVAIFLTGLPGVNQLPNGAPSEMLRLNTSILPTGTDPTRRTLSACWAGRTTGSPTAGGSSMTSPTSSCVPWQVPHRSRRTSTRRPTTSSRTERTSTTCRS